jgi:chromosomal replication initiation ATPase DnaA
MNAEQIIARVAVVFEVEPVDLTINIRLPKLRQARQAAALVMRVRCNLSYGDIAKALGYADHSSVQYAIQGAHSRSKTDATYSAKITQIGAM